MLNLTSQERQVIIFLTVVVLTGIGINFLTKKYSLIRAIVNFDQDFAKIDINQADRDTLMGIPGIGEKLAQRIIEYRAKSGGFNDVGELRQIKGINGYRYEKLKDKICVK